MEKGDVALNARRGGPPRTRCSKGGERKGKGDAPRIQKLGLKMEKSPKSGAR